MRTAATSERVTVVEWLISSASVLVSTSPRLTDFPYHFPKDLLPVILFCKILNRTDIMFKFTHSLKKERERIRNTWALMHRYPICNLSQLVQVNNLIFNYIGKVTKNINSLQGKMVRVANFRLFGSLSMRYMKTTNFTVSQKSLRETFSPRLRLNRNSIVS